MNSWVLDHLEKMRAFEAVVRSGSLVRASKELGVSQPALSRLIANLESVSGKRLLERSRLGCQPTPAGRAVVGFYERLLPMAMDLEQKVASGSQLCGVLSVGTFESFAATWWPEFLVKFGSEYPDLRISIRTAAPADHRRKLLEGALDLVVEACPEENERVTSEKVATDTFGVFVEKGLRKKKALELNSLRLTYVPNATDDRGRRILEAVEELGVRPREVYELDTFSAVYEFTAAGLGAGVLPHRLARKVAAQGLISEVGPVFGEHTICVSYLSENRGDPRIVALKRALKKYLVNKG